MHAQEPLLAGRVPEVSKIRPNQGTTTLNESTVAPAFHIRFHLINLIKRKKEREAETYQPRQTCPLQ